MSKISRKIKMATRKQKQELIDLLKFKPINARLLIQGYGGETYAGFVDKKIYDYFADRKIDIDAYASDWDNELEVPDDMQPYPPGSAYECDDLWHASGAEMSDLNAIRIDDEDGKTIWEETCGKHLANLGVTITEHQNRDIDSMPTGTIIHWGGQGEKGCFFDGELLLTSPFDPKKLEICCELCGDWSIITNVYYDGEEIQGQDGYSTTGKWNENKWIVVGETVYDEEDADDIPVLEGEETQAQEIIDTENDRSPWWGADIIPTIEGEYEVMEMHSSWPFPIRANWDGKTWKADGEKINIKEWRGLNYDPL